MKSIVTAITVVLLMALVCPCMLKLLSKKIYIINDSIHDRDLKPTLNVTENLINAKIVLQNNMAIKCAELLVNGSSDYTGSALFETGENLQKQNDLAALVGPTESNRVLLFHPHAVLTNVPHLSPLATDPIFEALDRFPHLIRMQKTYKHQIDAIFDLMTSLEWSSIGIISSESDFYHHAGERLKEAAGNRSVQVLFNRRLPDFTGSLDIQTHLDDLKRTGQRVIALICDSRLAKVVLENAKAAKMTGARWAWILWNDIVDDVVMKSDISSISTNHAWIFSKSIDLPDITGLLAIRTSYTKGRLFQSFMSSYANQRNGSAIKYPSVRILKYVDSILAVAYGLAQSDASGRSLLDKILLIKGEPGVTEDITIDSKTREAIYTPRFDILNSKSGKRWWNIGSWIRSNHSIKGVLSLNVSKLSLPGDVKQVTAYYPQIEYQKFQIVTIDSEPFVTIDYNKTSLSSDISTSAQARYSGLCVELLYALSEELGFEYTIRDLGPGGKFGFRNPVSGYWNGLIGVLVSGKADLVMAPLTITEDRATVVDLTSSFMETKLKFAINREAIMSGSGSVVYQPFSFLEPFSANLWVALVISVLLMAFYLTLISRLSPYGAHGHYFQSEKAAESSARLARRKSSAFGLESLQRRNSMTSSHSNLAHSSTTGFAKNQPKEAEINEDGRRLTNYQRKRRVSFSTEVDSDSDEEETQERQNARRFMSINNALYFACAGLLWQSPECVPRAPSARVAGGIWYMVGVIIVASYTANMVAFVTQTSTSSHIDTIENLLDQRIIPPGTVTSSSVDSLLMTSGLDVAERLYKEILRHPKTSLQPDVSSALQETNQGNLAFVWEGTSLDYAAAKDNCHLTTIELGFGKASYAFALRRGSEFTDVFNQQILKFRHNGFLEKLTKKYFSTSCHEVKREDDSVGDSYDRLTYDSLSGVFIMISVAGSLSIAVLLVEWIVACVSEIDRTDPKRPTNFRSSLKLRLVRLRDDFSNNWLPFKNIREHWSKFRPTQHNKTPTRLGIQPDQWKRFAATPGSEKLHPGESLSDPDVEIALQG